jgi:hypothetical protein
MRQNEVNFHDHINAHLIDQLSILSVLTNGHTLNYVAIKLILPLVFVQRQQSDNSFPVSTHTKMSISSAKSIVYLFGRCLNNLNFAM